MSKMTIEEIQDILAEFENRISFLENSMPFEKAPHREPEPREYTHRPHIHTYTKQAQRPDRKRSYKY